MAKTTTTTKEKVTKAPVEAKATAKKANGLAVPMYNLTGQEAGSIELPTALFGGLINKTLLSQAIRIYSSNLKSKWGNTKTRGQVEGSTRKIYKQKGTGGARHGAKRAPIFVGGGITFGPKMRKLSLKFPQKMKNAALIAALSLKVKDGQVKVLADGKVSGKTKEVVGFTKALNLKSTLFVTVDNQDMLNRATKNIQKVSSTSASTLNAYEVVRTGNLILTQASIAALEGRINGKDQANA